MGAVQPTPTLTLEAFLAWEDEQPERHEFLRGEVFAMTGARDAHNTVVGNLFAALKTARCGGPCRVFIADMKLAVDAADAVLYPDVPATCNRRDRGPGADRAKRHPSLIVEVLSESTAAYDGGLKFELYRRIEALREYLLVEADRRHADLFRREADGRWVLESYGPEGELALTSVGLRIGLDAIYEDVEGLAAGV